MGAIVSLNHELDPDINELIKRGYHSIAARQSFIGLKLWEPIIDGNKLSDDLVNVFDNLESPSQAINIVVDMGGFERISENGLQALMTSMSMVADNGGEIVLTNVGNAIREYLQRIGQIKSPDKNYGFRILEMGGSTGANKEK